MKIIDLKLSNFNDKEIKDFANMLIEKNNKSPYVTNSMSKKAIVNFAYIILYFIDHGIQNKNTYVFIDKNHYRDNLFANVSLKEVDVKDLRISVYEIDEEKNKKKTNNNLIKDLNLETAYHIFSKEIFKKLLNELGYKTGEFKENNKIITEIFNALSHTKRSYYYNNLNSVLGQDFKEYPELIYLSSKESYWDINYVIKKLKSPETSSDERMLIYSSYFRQSRKNEEIESFLQTDLNNKEILDGFANSRIAAMKNISNVQTGNARVNINNLCPAEYTCVVVFDYQRLRNEIKVKDKSSITRLIYKMVANTKYSTGMKEELCTLIVKSDFPIKPIELENFLSENFQGWIDKEISWDEEMAQFIGMQRSKLLQKRLTEETSVEDKVDKKNKRKI